MYRFLKHSNSTHSLRLSCRSAPSISLSFSLSLSRQGEFQVSFCVCVFVSALLCGDFGWAISIETYIYANILYANKLYANILYANILCKAQVHTLAHTYTGRKWINQNPAFTCYYRPPNMIQVSNLCVSYNCVSYDSFMCVVSCVQWLIHTCFVLTYFPFIQWLIPFIQWLIYMCPTTHSYASYNRATTHSQLCHFWHFSFICEKPSQGLALLTTQASHSVSPAAHTQSHTNAEHTRTHTNTNMLVYDYNHDFSSCERGGWERENICTCTLVHDAASKRQSVGGRQRGREERMDGGREERKKGRGEQEGGRRGGRESKILNNTERRKDGETEREQWRKGCERERERDLDRDWER